MSRVSRTALRGILNKIRNLGMLLLSVKRVKQDEKESQKGVARNEGSGG